MKDKLKWTLNKLEQKKQLPRHLFLLHGNGGNESILMIKSAWPGEVGKKIFSILMSIGMCNILSLKTWAQFLQINQALSFRYIDISYMDINIDYI